MQMARYMGLSRYRCLFVICIVACVLCGVYTKLFLTNEKLAVRHDVVHSMFANQGLSQDNKHNTVIFENVVKTNINIHKIFPMTQAMRKKEVILPTLFIAEDELLKNLKNNCSYEDALQGKSVFVVLKGNSVKVTLEKYKKKTAKEFIHQFSEPFKRDPNLPKLKEFVVSFKEFVVSFLMVQGRGAQHFTVDCVYFTTSSKSSEDYFAPQTVSSFFNHIQH